MNATATCPECGLTVRPEVPCPRCLLGQATRFSDSALGTDETQKGSPGIEALAAALPDYQDIVPLAEGGMGTVFKATHRKLSRPVAIKVLKPGARDPDAFRERFLREARALARLDHPCIVRVYDFGEAEGLPYLVMEYIEGATLRALLDDGQLSPEEVLELIPQICSALSYAHALGVVHRDVKPDNILVDDEGRVRIADFGLAKLNNNGQKPLHPTRADQVMGTPHYMAPEQLERPAEVDHRADIFSLGVVFYELLTGELPLGTFEPPSRKSRADARLDPVVLRALERDPDRRYQQVRDVDTAIKSMDTPSLTTASPKPETSRPARPSWLGANTWVAYGSALIGIGVAIFTVLYFSNPNRSQSPEKRASTAGTELEQGKAQATNDLALVRAAGRGDLEGVRRAVEAGANPDAVILPLTPPSPPVQGLPFALGQASAGGHEDIVRYLLERGARPDLSGDLTKDRAIHAASQAGYTSIVELLITHEAKLDSPDTQGHSPLLLALIGGHWDTALTLSKAGTNGGDLAIEAQTHATGPHPSDRALHHATRSGRLELVEALLSAGADPLAPGRYQRDAIWLACSQPDVRILQALLSASSRRGSLTHHLMEVVRSGHVDHVKLLIKAGADANGDQSGTTPLMLTAYSEGLDIAKELLRHGADPDKLHPDGKSSARAIAKKQNRTDLLALFDAK